jgi:phosphonate transport system substrate-binding protein
MKQVDLKYVWLIGLMIAVVAGCDGASTSGKSPEYVRQSDSQEKILHLAVHPLHNPIKLAEAYQPYVDYLNQHLPNVQIELESSRDYQAYEAKFRDRKPEILLPNPWQTLEAIKVGYDVIAMAGEAKDFKGIFIVRKDAGIKTPSDLKGKVVSYPSHTALAACIMPQYYLHQHGIDTRHDIENRYVGSQESSIMNAYLGSATAGATWPPPWRLFQKDRPDEAAELEVLWQTDSLINNSLMIRDDVTPEIREIVARLSYRLHESEQGRHILAQMETAGFFPANNQSYDVVKDFIQDFEREVREVETP